MPRTPYTSPDDVGTLPCTHAVSKPAIGENKNSESLCFRNSKHVLCWEHGWIAAPEVTVGREKVKARIRVIRALITRG